MTAKVLILLAVFLLSDCKCEYEFQTPGRLHCLSTRFLAKGQQAYNQFRYITHLIYYSSHEETDSSTNLSPSSSI